MLRCNIPLLFKTGLRYGITEWLEGTSGDHVVQPPKKGNLKHVVPNCVQAGFEYLQRRRLHSLYCTYCIELGMSQLYLNEQYVIALEWADITSYLLDIMRFSSTTLCLN